MKRVCYYHTLINLILFVLNPTHFRFIKGLTQGNDSV
jgi:hypothetical protein